jgi:hypothetical protein
MLVRNNTTEVRILAWQKKAGVPAKDNSPPIPPQVDHVPLMPGNNDVDPAVWAELVKNDGVRSLLETNARTGQIGRPILEAEKDISLKDISTISAKKAVRIVQETWDRGLLRSWQRPETRREVGDAIDSQLAKIERGTTAATQEEAITE